MTMARRNRPTHRKPPPRNTLPPGMRGATGSGGVMAETRNRFCRLAYGTLGSLQQARNTPGQTGRSPLPRHFPNDAAARRMVSPPPTSIWPKTAISLAIRQFNILAIHKTILKSRLITARCVVLMQLSFWRINSPVLKVAAVRRPISTGLTIYSKFPESSLGIFIHSQINNNSARRSGDD